MTTQHNRIKLNCEHIGCSSAGIREIARDVAKEELQSMKAEFREIVREVIDEKIGIDYAKDMEFLHSWMKKSEQISNGFFGKVGQGIFIVILAGIGALALVKFGFIAK